MQIVRTCPFTRKVNVMEIDVTDELLTAWQTGAPIQDAMPGLTPSEREFIKTGITPEVWNRMFGCEEE